MSAKISRRLIIDASVAHASGGEDATFPTSKNWRDFLKAVLTICHQIVMTSSISDEWKRHQSHFARGWLVSMTARRKVNRIDDPFDAELRKKIEKAAVNEKSREAMLKDIHLIEAAKATDQTVIALDETVRKLFTVTAKSIGVLKSIVWVNPDKTAEQAIAWLEQGAKSAKKRWIGFSDVMTK